MNLRMHSCALSPNSKNVPKSTASRHGPDKRSGHRGRGHCRLDPSQRSNNGQSTAYIEASGSWIGKLRYLGVVLYLRLTVKPMPKHHPVFGHFIALKQMFQTLPRNTTIHVVIREMSKQFPNGIFYLNLWPFNRPMVIITNPLAASQVEAAFLEKPDLVRKNMEIINGGPSLMSMHGPTWKKWRELFNPGFSAGYIGKLAPAIADEVLVFSKLLRDLVKKGKFFQLEEYTLRLTFDVITHVTLCA
jgi:hypothetical protein